MLKPERRRVVLQGLAYSLSVLVLLAFFATFSPSYQACQNTAQHDAIAENPKAVVDWSFRAGNFLPCEGEFIDKNEGNLTLAATFFIALFTYTLWRSTERLGDFAEGQSDDTKTSLKIARDAIEAARISAGAAEVLANNSERSLENERIALKTAAETAEAVKLIAVATKTQADTAREALRPRVFAQPWPHTARRNQVGEILFKVEMACYGNSPATVFELCVEYADKPPRGEIPIYSEEPQQTNVSLAPTNRWWYPDAANDFLRAPVHKPFIFGYIRYVDQFKVARTSRYSAKLEDPNSDGKFQLVTAGDPVYSSFD